MRAILGVPMIGRQVERLRRARRLSQIVLATSVGPEDDVVAAFAEGLGLAVYRGSLDDVLDRFHGALEAMPVPERFVRLTADCPLTEPTLVDSCIDRHLAVGADYTTLSLGGTFPKGLDVEICETEALRAAWREASDPYEREHVTPFIYRRPERFRVESITRTPPERWRWTVDTPEDFAFVEAVYSELYPSNPTFGIEEILAWQTRNPDRRLPNLE